MSEPTDYCAWCQRKMSPDILKRGLGYNGNGFFCTLRCGFEYGVEMLQNDDFRIAP